MKKISKSLLIVLAITALIVPMFISCEGETPPPVDYRAQFLTALGPEVMNLNTEAGIESASLSGQNFTIKFNNDANTTNIKTAAVAFRNALRDLTGVTEGTLTFEGEQYDLFATSHSDLESDVFAYLTEEDDVIVENSATLNYSATVKYKGQNISLTGTVTLKNIPDDLN